MAVSVLAGPPLGPMPGVLIEEQIVIGDDPDGKPMRIKVAKFRAAPEAEPGIDFVTPAASADLVFHGTVTDIQYVLSEPIAAEGGRVPHTLVTFAVHDVFQGSADGDSVTLRFIGGLNETTMRYLVRCESPQFDVGDEDILFVRGNGELACPLVGDSQGRIRIISGQAYTDAGRSLYVGSDGELRVGPRYRLADVDATWSRAWSCWYSRVRCSPAWRVQATRSTRTS